MNGCELFDTPEVELYFYDELGHEDRARVAAHLGVCAECRQRLEDLHAIRQALAGTPMVDAPPAGDWSGFMRRLDAAVALKAERPAAVVLERQGGTWRARHLVAIAALFVLVAMGVFMAARVRSHRPVDAVARTSAPSRVMTPASPAPETARATEPGTPGETPARALREVSAEHLERSKLVVLGLATRDPNQTRAADWQYERRLAGTLLPETRLYRQAAQRSGASDVARVMRDLETVLLETSMTDAGDREALERVQRLIARRGLVSKMQLVATSGI